MALCAGAGDKEEQEEMLEEDLERLHAPQVSVELLDDTMSKLQCIIYTVYSTVYQHTTHKFIG